MNSVKSEEPRAAVRGGCPVGAPSFGSTKTAPPHQTGRTLEQDQVGVWHVRGYQEARAILRADGTAQAGFRAEDIKKIPFMNKPVLYMEGQAHHEQRRATARFFTPRATQAYAELMRDYADEVLRPLNERGEADLSELALKMAVQVAARVIGLTNSRMGGMDARLSGFFEQPVSGGRLRRLKGELSNQVRLALFYLLDVRPAIRARQREPREDLITHLIESGYSHPEILAECIMYGAAGMVTTREFICAAAWHLLEQPERRAWFVGASEAERHAFLHELLRVEPVVGHLYRRTTEELSIESGGERVTLPAGSLVDLHLYEINADPSVVGDEARRLCPGREMAQPRVWPEVMGFGDGHHRCAGAYIAIQETDIFLCRLLADETLAIQQPPHLGWNPIAMGYELRAFIVGVDG